VKRRVIGWLEERTGLGALVRGFLDERVPASSGWRQVFGSVAVFLFLVQAFTGVLLGLNYAPTPGDAYNSLRYILAEVACGPLIRGLHHWGASMMIVVVVFHMIQVFLYGAYKKPREATWAIGVCLLLLTLAYGLTGYLLPWDNRAYWGTVVTTQIADRLPFIGQYVARLLGSDGQIGVVTFARFYGAHVLLMPAITVLLIVLHIRLVRLHGVTPAAGDTAPPKKFFPDQALKDTIAIFVAFTILFVMAAALRVPLDRLADPTDASYIPRPEWYFLFLFQTLKLFKSSLEPIGTVVLPTLAVLALFLVPFLDRGRVRALTQRAAAVTLVVLALLGWTALTITAVATTPAAVATASGGGAAPSDWRHLSPEELAGIGYFRQESCSVCHNLADGPAKVGPDLSTVGQRKSAAWMIAHFRNPPQLMPGSNMPPIQLGGSQLNALAAFLLKLTAQNATALESAPAPAVAGAQLFQANGCAACHTVNGLGGRIGPPLNGLPHRHDKAWVATHFTNPRALSPGSTMPPYNFSGRDMERIIAYLFSLPGETAP
jgi:ubiquinol-cytochrome c reductase cytochrome b subunit